MKYLIVLLCATFLSGCMMFASEIDQVTGKIGEAADRYCFELAQPDRAVVRDQVNPTAGGATITVVCPGDS